MGSSHISHDVGNNQPSVSSLVGEESADDAFDSWMEDKAIPIQPKGTLARDACCYTRLSNVPISVHRDLERIRFQHRQFPEDTQGYRQWDRGPIPQNVQGGCGFGGDSGKGRWPADEAMDKGNAGKGGGENRFSHPALHSWSALTQHGTQSCGLITLAPILRWWHTFGQSPDWPLA